MNSVNDAIGRLLEGSLPDAEKGGFSLSAEADIKTFACNGSRLVGGPGKKVHVQLAGADSCRASIQVLRKDRENGVPAQPGAEFIYMVLKGRVKFYGAGDVELGDFGPHEGILLPENSRYSFGSVGEEDAWLLQVSGDSKAAKH